MPMSNVYNTSIGLSLSLGILRAVSLPLSHSARRSRGALFGCMVWLSVTGGFPLAPGEAATTIVVTSLADPGTGGCTPADCTLREAIAAAQAGDTITFAATLFASGPGILRLTSGEMVINTDLTIQGPGRTRLKLDGNKASRVLHIATGTVVTIDGITIRKGRCCSGGLPSIGGGLYNGGTLTLSRSTIIESISGAGGGLYNDGSLTLSRSIVTQNGTDSRLLRLPVGGGLYNGGTVTIAQSTFSGNSARYNGGGLYNDGTVTIVQSTFSGNSARYFGGGFHNGGIITVSRSILSGNIAGHQSGGGFYNGGTITVSRSTLSGNIANYGGGIENRGTITVSRSTLSGNTVNIYGGGISNYGGTVTVSQSTLSGNSAMRGGGLDNDGGGTVTIAQSTFSGNFAFRPPPGASANPDGGGGLSNENGRLRIRASIIAGNTVATGFPGPDCLVTGGTLQSQGHNLVGAGTGCPNDPSRGDVTVNPALVFADVLGPLQPNGGPTWTHALRPESPALDAADPDRCPATDQRGVARPQGVGCDIGAFELEVP